MSDEKYWVYQKYIQYYYNLLGIWASTLMQHFEITSNECNDKLLH